MTLFCVGFVAGALVAKSRFDRERGKLQRKIEDYKQLRSKIKSTNAELMTELSKRVSEIKQLSERIAPLETRIEQQVHQIAVLQNETKRAEQLIQDVETRSANQHLGLQQENVSSESQYKTDFEIVRDIVHDVGAAKCEVILEIIVPNDLTREQLQQRLSEAFALVVSRQSCRHSPSELRCHIAAFTSRKMVDSGWSRAIARLDKDTDSIKVNITVNDGLLASMQTSPSERFGLSTDERQAIYKELVQAEYEAGIEADRFYPPNNPSDVSKSIEYERSVLEKLKDEIAKRNRLDRDQLESIAAEGFENVWPLPPFPNKEWP